MEKLFLITITLFALLNMQNAFTQDYDNAEFLIVNNTGNNIGYFITFDTYPVNAIFNGANPGEYTMIAANPISVQNNKIFGVQQYFLSNQINQKWYSKINFDKSNQNSQCDFSLGYGKYRIDFYVNSIKTFSCDVDFSDANYTGTSIPGYFQQFKIEYRNDGTVWALFNDNSASYYQIGNGNTFAVWDQLGTLNGSQIQSKGNFSDSQDPSPIYHQFPLDARNFGHFVHISPEQINLNLKVTNYDASCNTDLFQFNNSKFYLDIGKTYSMSVSSCKLAFYGTGAEFISDINSTVIFPQYGEIDINENAGINSTGTEFKTLSSTIPWNGIWMYKASSTYINDCSFSYAPDAIGVFNSNHVIISNNKIFVAPPDAYIYLQSWGVNLNNVNDYLISYNHFWLPNDPGLETYGVFDYLSTDLEDDYDIPTNRHNITGNDFHDGFIQIFTYGLIDNLISVYINENSFYGGSRNIESYYTIGNFAYNNFSHSYLDFASIYLVASKPNLLNNNMANINDNIAIRYGSYPNLAPLQIDNQLIWIAGQNTLSSSNNCNIDINTVTVPGYFFTDQGKNNFYRTQSNYNFFGYLDDSAKNYYTNGNCWFLNNNPAEPSILLRRPSDNSIIPVTWEYPQNCSWNDEIIDKIITGSSNGNIDTILISQSNSVPLPSSDESLYAVGVKNKELKSYSTSITNFKDLINSYSDSKYLESAIYELYSCYVLSDTSHSQNWRNIIFGDFKNYLLDKIQQYKNNDEMLNITYDFYLKCLVKLKSYDFALEGYQFIANNNPYALARYLASINYIAVEGLIQGQGGGEKGYSIKDMNFINESEGIKPIKDILIKSFSKIENSINQKEQKELKISKDLNKTKYILDREHSSDKILRDRALYNIIISKNLDKKQRNDLIMKALTVYMPREINDYNIKEHNTISAEYSLSQNYPNPFNPTTTIKYALPKSSFVTIKVYDIVGREMMQLVNEFKPAGFYNVNFNGSNLASGVYFYRIQAGDPETSSGQVFVSVKRMVLIK